MANKIMIDGVDVSECSWYKQGATGMICADWLLSNDCSKNLNCYYKQLKRKEKECKILKEKLEQQKGYTVSYKSYVYEQLDQLKAENEKLKEYLKIGKITTLEDGDLVFESKFIDEFAKENAKLKQALDEIEKFIENPLIYMDENIYNNISNIINKAKDGE